MSHVSSNSSADYQAWSERTLALIKPEAYEDAEAIENTIRDHGFNILAVCNCNHLSDNTHLFPLEYTEVKEVAAC